MAAAVAAVGWLMWASGRYRVEIGAILGPIRGRNFVCNRHVWGFQGTVLAPHGSLACPGHVPARSVENRANFRAL